MFQTNLTLLLRRRQVCKHYVRKSDYQIFLICFDPILTKIHLYFFLKILAPITQTESDNISTLVGMGFDRSQVYKNSCNCLSYYELHVRTIMILLHLQATQALAAAVGNIERAVEYLQTV